MSLTQYKSALGSPATRSLTARQALFDWYQPQQMVGPLSMRIGFRTVDGVRIRVAESDGPEERAILLTSPWPESLYAFAPIWRALSRRFRLFAVDLPGFGGSESRSDLLSPQAMGTFLLRLIDDCELGRPHIVAPDIATPAALFAAACEPAAVASVVVGSGAASVPLDLGAPLSDWVADPHPECSRSIDAETIVNATIGTISGHVPTAIREDYLKSYAGDRCSESINYVRRYPEELPILAGLLPAIHTPSLVFAGSRDRAVPVSNAEFLAAHLPRCQFAVLGAGHFVWEDAPDAFSEMISGWVTEGYREVARDDD